jgi:cellulose synthase/poly-beta-1,6-N-acetylglucosamine synthase-like glycosyltransferase
MGLNLVEFSFFFYMFVGLYMLSLLLLIYIPNRRRLFSYPRGKPVPVSIVMPSYNEGAHLGKAIESLLALDYPKHLIEIIVVDDCSTDNSAAVVRHYARRHKNVRLIINKRNSGGAAEPTNIGIRAARFPYVAVADADSTPERDALTKMVGFLQAEKNVAAVTCAVLAKPPRTFIQKLQAIEYVVIAWSRKLLDLVDSVYVTPGPFALYSRDALLRVGLFDVRNMTQDIEIVWRLLSQGYKARMCLGAAVYSETPERFRSWFKQRVRWNIGGTQTLLKYKHLFFRHGMLGAFILPFFSFSLFLGLLGLCIFAYLFARRTLVFYLSTRYSIYADSAIVHLQDLNLTPSILNLFGIFLFVAGVLFTFTGLAIMKNRYLHQHNLFNIFFYILIYLTIYPIIMVTALYRLWRGRYSW